MTLDLDSTITEVHGHQKQGAAYGYTRQLGYHPLVATRGRLTTMWRDVQGLRH